MGQGIERDESTETIVARAGAGLSLCLVSIVLFAVSDPLLHPDAVRSLYAAKAVQLVVIAATYQALRMKPSCWWAITLTVTTTIVMAFGVAASGIITDDPLTTPLVLVLLSMGTATLIPWGVRAQIITQFAIVVAALLHMQWVGQGDLTTYVPVALIVSSLAAIYVQYAGEQQRRTVRRREGELARMHTEHRVVDAAHAARLTSLGGMAGALAHELNQPLAAIVSYASGCVRRIEAGEDRPEALLPVIQEIRAQGLRAGEVIRRIREFLQPGSRRGRVDVNHIVREATTLAEIETRTHEVLVELDLSPHALVIVADGIQIEQVVLNLVRNACDALRSHPTITPRRIQIRTRNGDGMATTTVTDNGPGLAHDVAAHIFEPFVTSKADGLGLGLSISRTIVEAHGGRLAFDAVGPDGPTAFSFALPLATEVHTP